MTVSLFSKPILAIYFLAKIVFSKFSVFFKFQSFLPTAFQQSESGKTDNFHSYLRVVKKNIRRETCGEFVFLNETSESTEMLGMTPFFSRNFERPSLFLFPIPVFFLNIPVIFSQLAKRKKRRLTNRSLNIFRFFSFLASRAGMVCFVGAMPGPDSSTPAVVAAPATGAPPGLDVPITPRQLCDPQKHFCASLP